MNKYIGDGNQVYIRPINYHDTECVVNWRNQDNVKRFFFYREEFTKEIHEKWMKESVETGKVVQFIICMKDDNRPVGSTYLRDIDMQSMSAEYGVFLGDESVRGCGIGKEVLGLTLEYAWNTLGLKRIISRAIESNIPSITCFLHSGFSVDEVVKNVRCSDGKFENMVLMSIKRKGEID